MIDAEGLRSAIAAALEDVAQQLPEPENQDARIPAAGRPPIGDPPPDEDEDDDEDEEDEDEDAAA